ncbi:restriction endonuclease subunit S [Vibrio vulnificus]|uniref:restriction endonuclease subunit S n=1 Tax=Vibrio vulnificus TaxID=672 RepID=UPI00102958B0|nr:restriction endonuclease subunit S [Vibrio vulnificus]RZP59065.1 restriction endonuclease subunit S [Vibrio vulnificus]
MSFDWPEVRLGDYIDSCLGKMLDKKKNKGTLQPYLGNSNVRWGNFDLNDLAQMKFEDSEHERYSLESGDLVVCEGGEPGRCAIWEGEVEGMKIQKALHRVRPNQYLNNYYLYYWFLYAGKTGSLEPYFTGTTIKHLTGRALANLPIRIPPLDIQLQCVSVLYSLDKKISHNIKTNQTLEEMAQAIFKSWFVDFDPVKAKMNGEQPEGMDEATASLFPEKLDSETGIPVGWSQGIIADIAKLNAKSWTKKNQPEQVHYVDLANTKNGVIETVTTYDFEEAPSRARRVLNSGDTIVGTVRPGNRSFAFIGETEQPLTGSTGFAVLSPKKEFWTSFVYLATTNDDAIDEYARLADGGAYPAIKPVVIADTPCVIPTKDIAQKFWQLTGVMLKKAHQNRLENEELAKLRDALLPKLLSGELTLD